MARKAAPEGANKKVFDVAKPGKSAPDASSRPIIIGHKPMIQDPMMSAPAAHVTEPEDKPSSAPTVSTETAELANNFSISTKKIVPMSEAIDEVAEAATKPAKIAADSSDDSTAIKVTSTKKDEANKPEPEAEAATEPETAPEVTAPANTTEPDETKSETPAPAADEKTESTAEAKPAPESAAPAESTDKPEPVKDSVTPAAPTAKTTEHVNDSESDTAEVDVLAQAAKDKNAEKQVNQEDAAKNAIIDKLVAEKKYFVPIGETKRKRSSRAATVVFLLLLIIAIGVYLAIDAGYLDVDLDMPYDLIKT